MNARFSLIFFRQIFAILFADYFSKMCTESAGELEIMKKYGKKIGTKRIKEMSC